MHAKYFIIYHIYLCISLVGGAGRSWKWFMTTIGKVFRLGYTDTKDKREFCDKQWNTTVPGPLEHERWINIPGAYFDINIYI